MSGEPPAARILLVEDEPNMARTLARILAKADERGIAMVLTATRHFRH